MASAASTSASTEHYYTKSQLQILKQILTQESDWYSYSLPTGFLTADKPVTVSNPPEFVQNLLKLVEAALNMPEPSAGATVARAGAGAGESRLADDKSDLDNILFKREAGGGASVSGTTSEKALPDTLPDHRLKVQTVLDAFNDLENQKLKLPHKGKDGEKSRFYKAIEFLFRNKHHDLLMVKGTLGLFDKFKEALPTYIVDLNKFFENYDGTIYVVQLIPYSHLLLEKFLAPYSAAELGPLVNFTGTAEILTQLFRDRKAKHWSCLVERGADVSSFQYNNQGFFEALWSYYTNDGNYHSWTDSDTKKTLADHQNYQKYLVISAKYTDGSSCYHLLESLMNMITTYFKIFGFMLDEKDVCSEQNLNGAGSDHAWKYRYKIDLLNIFGQAALEAMQKYNLPLWRAILPLYQDHLAAKKLSSWQREMQKDIRSSIFILYDKSEDAPSKVNLYAAAAHFYTPDQPEILAELLNGDRYNHDDPTWQANVHAALLYAIGAGKIAAVQFILSNTLISLKRLPSNTLGPIHQAVLKLNGKILINMLGILKEHALSHFDINEKCKEEKTPLHYATIKRDKLAVAWLLYHDANKDIKMPLPTECTPKDVALRGGWAEGAALFEMGKPALLAVINSATEPLTPIASRAAALAPSAPFADPEPAASAPAEEENPLGPDAEAAVATREIETQPAAALQLAAIQTYMEGLQRQIADLQRRAEAVTAATAAAEQIAAILHPLAGAGAGAGTGASESKSDAGGAGATVTKLNILNTNVQAVMTHLSAIQALLPGVTADLEVVKTNVAADEAGSEHAQRLVETCRSALSVYSSGLVAVSADASASAAGPRS